MIQLSSVSFDKKQKSVFFDELYDNQQLIIKWKELKP